MAVENELAERVRALVEQSPARSRVPIDATAPGLDLEFLKNEVLVRLHALRDPKLVSFDASIIDVDVFAAVIASQLLPNRIRPTSGPGRYLTYDGVARLVARSLGVPRSGLVPALTLDPGDAPW